MGYKIKKRFITDLPEGEKKHYDTVEALGEHLYRRQSGACALCQDDMNKAAEAPAEVMVVDHDVPEIRGGTIKLSNIQLVHSVCNSVKSDMTTSEIKPYCRFRRHLMTLKGSPQYGNVLKHFDINLSKIEVDIKPTTMTWTFGDNSKITTKIFTDSSIHRDRDPEYRFTYVEIPKDALWNDEEVQPRAIYDMQIRKIFHDLIKNPLHEPPSCRLDEEGPDGLRKILMFDGQHKTISYWLHGNEKIVVKVYLDITRNEATYLVNSIQSKINKLKLSTFELASKMEQEYQDKLALYLKFCNDSDKEPSESGFIAWTPAVDQDRTKEALKEALFISVLEHDDFRFKDFVRPSGERKKKDDIRITQIQMKNKVFKELCTLKPLEEPFTESATLRETERDNIIWLTNCLVDRLADPDPDGVNDELSVAQLTARSRFFTGAVLKFTSSLVQQMYYFIKHKRGDRGGGMFEDLDDNEREILEERIDTLCSHDAWFCDWDVNDEMKALKVAIDENRFVEEKFDDVALDLAYTSHADEYAPFTKLWRKGK